MSIALYDSAIFGSLFADDTLAPIFSDEERVRSMLAVEAGASDALVDWQALRDPALGVAGRFLSDTPPIIPEH